jgi:hypothetical protein
MHTRRRREECEASEASMVGRSAHAAQGAWPCVQFGQFLNAQGVHRAPQGPNRALCASRIGSGLPLGDQEAWSIVKEMAAVSAGRGRRYAALAAPVRSPLPRTFGPWYGPGLGRVVPPGSARRMIVRWTMPSCWWNGPVL